MVSFGNYVKQLLWKQTIVIKTNNCYKNKQLLWKQTIAVKQYIREYIWFCIIVYSKPEWFIKSIQSSIIIRWVYLQLASRAMGPIWSKPIILSVNMYLHKCIVWMTKVLFSVTSIPEVNVSNKKHVIKYIHV